MIHNIYYCQYEYEIFGNWFDPVRFYISLFVFKTSISDKKSIFYDDKQSSALDESGLYLVMIKYVLPCPEFGLLKN